ncbi:hypothetical protein GGI07_001393 [Coemansia sp. Benny D115]|nr:hypothetical protein GGI07_001393 [Coemansia sp. Benny D115]
MIQRSSITGITALTRALVAQDTRIPPPRRIVAIKRGVATNAQTLELAEPPQSLEQTQPQPQTPTGPERPCLPVKWPLDYTHERIDTLQPLLHRVSNLPLVRGLADHPGFDRKEYNWPLGERRVRQASETLAFGALSGPGDLAIPPLVFRWKPQNIPGHINRDVYSGSFGSTEEYQQHLSMRVPGITMVQYLGKGLLFTGSLGPVAHPGVPTALLDDITARVGFSNRPGRPIFTANFQLEYLGDLPVDGYVVADAWATRTENRKTFVASYLADAVSGQVYVRAKSLFISAA